MLTGNVTVTLCNACRTEWSEVVRDCPAWQSRIELDARQNHYNSLAYAGTPVSEAEWVALRRDQDGYERELHAVGVAFVKPIPSPVPVGERDD